NGMQCARRRSRICHIWTLCIGLEECLQSARILRIVGGSPIEFFLLRPGSQCASRRVVASLRILIQEAVERNQIPGVAESVPLEFLAPGAGLVCKSSAWIGA